MACFVQQGDTNVPAIPSNVLDMMRNHQEEEESKTMMKIHLNSNDLIQDTIYCMVRCSHI